EDDKTVAARQVLRKFAAKWWYRHQAKLVREWLQQLGTPSQADIDGVNDCLRRLKATTNFTWNRGIRILFWKFKDQDWRKDFCDGVHFWKTAEPPRGNMKNMTAPSRNAELLAPEKVFKLWTPRFIVPKVIENEGTSEEKIVDVRLVWDCKINGFNDQVVKWLLIPVEKYLQLDSLVVDYTQDTSVYIKSKQADIDVGQHFNNFRVHADDRKYMGVKFVQTNNAPGAVESSLDMCCTSLPFESRCSPYLACQGQARILEECK
ncbi:hypothetical protein ACHAXR_000640, partial [Thalassiosira sp. AJA248-18]